MSLGEVVVEGTLKPDGTLDLDEAPSLSPGRVQVTVKPLPPASASRPALVEIVDDIKKNQQSRGYHGRTQQEMEVEEEARQEENEEYERRCELLWGGPPPAATP